MEVSAGGLVLVDIGANLTDPMFFGEYNRKVKHSEDVDEIFARASKVGVRGILVTGVNAEESKKAIQMCNKYSKDGMRCFSTVGCHPTHCSEFLSQPDIYFEELDALLGNNSVKCGGVVAAVGEIGLDYDRLRFCDREVQKTYFAQQLLLAEKHKLPVFLHDRNTSGDFLQILSPVAPRLHGGVVHSFTGTEQELISYLDLGLYIGINGCSLKTEENIRVVKLIPANRILIETDCPWCEIKNSHASRQILGKSSFSDKVLSQFSVCKKEKYVKGWMVKGRCEPCHILQVLNALFLLNQKTFQTIESFAEQILQNTLKIFPCFNRGTL